MGVWAGPDWPEAGLEQSRRLPLPGARTAGGASRIPAQPRPGDALAPGTLARAGYHGGPPTPANSAPSGQWGSLPRLQAGRYKGREARPGTEPGVGKVKAEEGEGTGEDGGGRGSLRAVPPASGRCPQPRSGGRGGNADQQPFNPRPRGSPHKEEQDPQPPPGARTARRAPAADGQRRRPSPRPSGAGVRAGRPSPGLTHSSVPQLMAEFEATQAV